MPSTFNLLQWLFKVKLNQNSSSYELFADTQNNLIDENIKAKLILANQVVASNKERTELMTYIVLKICKYLGYDFNTVELAIRDGVPYAIDFCNPAPDAERTSVGEENFAWVVETAANYAIERALENKEGQDNLTWGEYVKRSADKMNLI